MADVLRFVDRADPAATVRLDLNDDSGVLHVRDVVWSPPRLRRGFSHNLMTDGGIVSASAYDLRTLALSFDAVAASQDAYAVAWQALVRELDRETNWLMYQPTGASRPVFFRTYRSDVSSLVDLPAAVAFRQFTVDLLTDPLAVGSRESMTTTTVTNDPAAGSNGMSLVCAAVAGDVPAPAVVVMSHLSPLTAFDSLFLATRRDDNLANVNYEQLSTGYTDTTNPGGAADAAMSGTGTTNYLRTTFATTTAMADRVDFTETMPRGSYRMLAVVRRSDATSVMRARFVRTTSGGTAQETGPEVTIPQTTNRQILDLGLFSFGRGDLDTIGHATEGAADEMLACFGRGQAQRVSGSGTLDWDLLIALPTSGEVTLAAPTGTGAGATAGLVVDAVQQQAVPYVPGGDPFAGTADANGPAWSVSGGFPMLHPTTPNRLVIAWTRSAGHVVTDTMSVRVHYWPRYLHLRPNAS